MNIGIYIINSKDKNAECGNTKNSTSQIKKKTSLFTGFIIIFKGQLRERERVERLRERQREVKEEYKDSRGEREQECEREKRQQGTKSRVVERTREVKESNM